MPLQKIANDGRAGKLSESWLRSLSGPRQQGLHEQVNMMPARGSGIRTRPLTAHTGIINLNRDYEWRLFSFELGGDRSWIVAIGFDSSAKVLITNVYKLFSNGVPALEKTFRSSAVGELDINQFTATAKDFSLFICNPEHPPQELRWNPETTELSLERITFFNPPSVRVVGMTLEEAEEQWPGQVFEIPETSGQPLWAYVKNNLANYFTRTAPTDLATREFTVESLDEGVTALGDPDTNAEFYLPIEQGSYVKWTTGSAPEVIDNMVYAGQRVDGWTGLRSIALTPDVSSNTDPITSPLPPGIYRLEWGSRYPSEIAFGDSRMAVFGVPGLQDRFYLSFANNFFDFTILEATSEGTPRTDADFAQVNGTNEAQTITQMIFLQEWVVFTPTKTYRLQGNNLRHQADFGTTIKPVFLENWIMFWSERQQSIIALQWQGERVGYEGTNISAERLNITKPVRRIYSTYYDSIPIVFLLHTDGTLTQMTLFKEGQGTQVSFSDWEITGVTYAYDASTATTSRAYLPKVPTTLNGDPVRNSWAEGSDLAEPEESDEPAAFVLDIVTTEKDAFILTERTSAYRYIDGDFRSVFTTTSRILEVLDPKALTDRSLHRIDGSDEEFSRPHNPGLVSEQSGAFPALPAPATTESGDISFARSYFDVTRTPGTKKLFSIGALDILVNTEGMLSTRLGTQTISTDLSLPPSGEAGIGALIVANPAIDTDYWEIDITVPPTTTATQTRHVTVDGTPYVIRSQLVENSQDFYGFNISFVIGDRHSRRVYPAEIWILDEDDANTVPERDADWIISGEPLENKTFSVEGNPYVLTQGQDGNCEGCVRTLTLEGKLTRGTTHKHVKKLRLEGLPSGKKAYVLFREVRQDGSTGGPVHGSKAFYSAYFYRSEAAQYGWISQGPITAIDGTTLKVSGDISSVTYAGTTYEKPESGYEVTLFQGAQTSPTHLFTTSDPIGTLTENPDDFLSYQTSNSLQRFFTTKPATSTLQRLNISEELSDATYTALVAQQLGAQPSLTFNGNETLESDQLIHFDFELTSLGEGATVVFSTPFITIGHNDGKLSFSSSIFNLTGEQVDGDVGEYRIAFAWESQTLFLYVLLNSSVIFKRQAFFPNEVPPLVFDDRTQFGQGNAVADLVVTARISPFHLGDAESYLQGDFTLGSYFGRHWFNSIDSTIPVRQVAHFPVPFSNQLDMDTGKYQLQDALLDVINLDKSQTSFNLRPVQQDTVPLTSGIMRVKLQAKETDLEDSSTSLDELLSSGLRVETFSEPCFIHKLTYRFKHGSTNSRTGNR